MAEKYLAIDIGMTNIDLVMENGDQISTRLMKNQHGNAVGQVRQALSLLQEDLPKGVVIGVTGGRYRDLPEILDGHNLQKIDEMQALGLGGLTLTGLEKGLVVSAGTGTAMVAAREKEIRHVTGSAVGGGTLLGLSKLILGTDDYNDINDLALAGDAAEVDIMLTEAVGGEVGRLPGDANAVNLGKLVQDKDFSHEDLAAGLVRLVAQVMAVIAFNAADAEKLDKIIIVGHLMDMESIRKEIDLVGKFYNRSFIIPENPGFGTAMGVLHFIKERK